MNKTAHAYAMDGFDVWYFGGTPGPDEVDSHCGLKDPLMTSADEDDTGTLAFAHRCHCGRHRQPALGAQIAAGRSASHADAAALQI